jgi:CutA1 divalent ion tolerance protein
MLVSIECKIDIEQTRPPPLEDLKCLLYRRLKMDVKFSVIITTVENRAAADKLARLLLAQRLAACIQVIPIASYYTWNVDYSPP